MIKLATSSRLLLACVDVFVVAVVVDVVVVVLTAVCTYVLKMWQGIFGVCVFISLRYGLVRVWRH